MTIHLEPARNPKALYVSIFKLGPATSQRVHASLVKTVASALTTIIIIIKHLDLYGHLN